MKRIAFLPLIIMAFAMCVVSCNKDKMERKAVVENVDQYKPNLPAVPSIPTPSVEETYGDGSYSVHGLRKNIRNTIEQQVEVTAYIANIYQKPECPEGKTCHTLMPHLFLADDSKESLQKRQLRLVGYAQSFKDMEEEQERVEKGEPPKELPDGVFLPPVIWDWRLGNKYKIKGRFTRRSVAGFMETDGLLEYESHECLDCPVEEEEEEKK